MRYLRSTFVALSLALAPASAQSQTPNSPGSEDKSGWEISFKLAPWADNGYHVADRFVDPAIGGDAGFEPRDFLLTDGQLIRLVRNNADRKRNEVRGTPGRAYLAAASVELAYLRPDGLRISAGVGYRADKAGSGPDYARLGDAGPISYYLINDLYRNEKLYLYGGLQYVINHGGRLRVHLGMSFMATFMDLTDQSEVLYGGSPVALHPVSTTRTENYFGLLGVTPLPQLTFEYLLSEDFSVNVGFGPALGPGAGYRIH